MDTVNYKSVIEWLTELPDGYRELAIRYWAASELSSLKHSSVPSMSAALLRAFEWKSTEEGSTFWREVREHYNNREVKTKPLPSL